MTNVKRKKNVIGSVKAGEYLKVVKNKMYNEHFALLAVYKITYNF